MNTFWQNKKVLLTGAGGFIGSHLAEALALQGAQVRALVRYNSRNDPGLLRCVEPQILAQIEILPADLRDAEAVNQAARGVSHIFHLGALIAIPYSYLHPREVVETNLLGTLNVLLAARQQNVERVVHTSSSEVYGTALRVPMDETHPLQGQSPYSASKIGADKLAESFFCAYGLPVATLRPFNTFGPRQSARAIIPTLVAQALTQPVLRLGNLKARRDFTYVSDTVQGFLAIAQTPGMEGQTLNLGSGREVSIGELAQIIIRLSGRSLSIETDPQRLRPARSEVQRLLSDNRLAAEKIHWRPAVSLEAGLQAVFDWVRANPGLYNPQAYTV